MIHRLARTLVGLAVALGAMFLVRTLVPAEEIQVDLEIWGVFFTVFGLIYAIIVGLLLVDSLNRFYILSSTFHDELNAIQDIRDLLIYVNDNEATKAKIRIALVSYVDTVVELEWDEMALFERGEVSFYRRSRAKDFTLDSDTSGELYDVMLAVEELEIIDESDQVALSSIIGKLCETTSYRTRRVELAKKGLPPTLRFLILFMSFVIAVGFLFINIPSIWMHTYMIVAVNTAIHLLYMVITDLDTPFQGFWNIDRRPFRALVANMQRGISQETYV